jgi:hypothetical protein
MKKLLPLFLCLMLTLSVTACAGLGAVLRAVDTAVNDSGQALDIIQTTFNVYQSTHEVSPEQRAYFQKLIANAYLTLRTGSQAVAPLKDIDQKEYDAAFKDFKAAYVALRDYLVAEGITPAGVGLVGASQAGGDPFPAPAVIGLRVQ